MRGAENEGPIAAAASKPPPYGANCTRGASGLLLEQLRRLRLKALITRARRDDCGPVGDGRPFAVVCKQSMNGSRGNTMERRPRSHSDQLTSSVLKWARALLLCACSPRVGARRQPEPVPVSTAIWVTTSRSTSAVHGCTPPYYGIIVPPKCGFSNYNVFCEQGARSVERSARDARGGR